MSAPASGSASAALPARAEHRQLRGWLLTAGALALAIAGFGILDGLRSAQLAHTLEAERDARAVAAELALAMQRAETRLHGRLEHVRAALAALPGGPGSADRLAATEDLLREQLPDLLDLRHNPALTPPAGRVSTALLADAEPADPGQGPNRHASLRLGHWVVIDGARMLLYQTCDDICRVRVPDWAEVHLTHGGHSWPLTPTPVADAERAEWLPATPDDPIRNATASAAIPHLGAVDWEVAVHRRMGFGPLPALLASLLLVLLTAGAAYWLWRSGRRRETRLLRELQRLTANQRKLEAVLDSTTDGIVMLDSRHRVELLNPAAEVMFGRLEADVLGAAVTGLLPELATPDVTDTEPPDPVVYDTQAVRGGMSPFPARIAERRLLLEDGPHRLLLVQDLTEQERQARQMTYLEQRDVITGLLNRAEFERRMARVLAEAAGSDTPHVLCYIDIDQFKVINDTVGHAAGDALIGQLAKIIEVKLGAAAVVGRLGGDEFGALFADCTEADALAICEDLMQTVRNFLFTWREHSYDVAVSIGVTAFMPEHESPEAELAKADVACHMAKREGRDRVHVYRDSDASLIRHHGEMHLVSAITQALSSGRFRLYAQPIIPLSGAEPRGGRTHYEILVRMLDEQGQPVAPDAFIPAAERYILMPAVDRWIIHQLFSTQHERMRQWHHEHPREFLFAVNLSGTSVSDESFLPYLKRQFEVHAVPPAAVCFEVTETAAMRNIGQARGFIGSLAELGCSFALDDFGSGLASYGYLRDLPLHYLKIDGCFVRDMHTDPVNYALVASINQVAHVLGLKTIAEWAENEYIINQLRALNVDFVQGFAIGTPLPVAACDAKVTAGMCASAQPGTDEGPADD